MIKLKALCYLNKRCKVIFDTRLVSEGPDNGARVKHYIFRDLEDSVAFWHYELWLSRDIEPVTFPTFYASERLFWGKVRLVIRRSILRGETWKAVAEAVNLIERKEE